MADGKRVRDKKQYAEPANAGDRKGKIKQDDSRAKPGTGVKEPVEGGDRKQGPKTESSSDVSRAFPKRKRARVSPSAKLHSTVSKSASRQQEDAEASPPHDHTKEYDQVSTKFPNLAIRQRDDAALPGVATLSTPPASRGDSETSLVKYPDSPHPDLWIWFGRLQCLKNPAVSFPLRVRNDGSECLGIMFGYDQGCDFIICGPGIGPYHCLLDLELSMPDEGPLRRQVVVKKIQTIISPPSLRTTIWVGEEAFVVEDKFVLPPGGIIQFGNGERYLYYGPKAIGQASDGSRG